MSWKEYYQKHRMSAAEAIQLVRSGNVVSIGHAVGEPTALVDALVANADQLHDVELLHMVLMGKGEYLTERMQGHFRTTRCLLAALPAARSSRDAPTSPLVIFIWCPSCCAPACSPMWP